MIIEFRSYSCYREPPNSMIQITFPGQWVTFPPFI